MSIGVLKFGSEAMSIFCGVHRFAFYYDPLFSYMIGCTSVSLLFSGWVGGGFLCGKTLVGALWWW